ncbi:MAG: hypothetical protein WCF25_11920 [Acidimicrobiales bacterium]
MLPRRAIIAVAMMTLAIIGVATPSNATNTPVSVQVQLNTTNIRAGHSIHGTAIITNASSKSIYVAEWSCIQWLLVGLANKKIAYDPAVAIAACAHSHTLNPGVTRVPITVSTKYDACGGGSQKGTVAVPRCTKVGKELALPALPKGKYHVVVIALGLTVAPYHSQLRVTLS